MFMENKNEWHILSPHLYTLQIYLCYIFRLIFLKANVNIFKNAMKNSIMTVFIKNSFEYESFIIPMCQISAKKSSRNMKFIGILIPYIAEDLEKRHAVLIEWVPKQNGFISEKNIESLVRTQFIEKLKESLLSLPYKKFTIEKYV